MVIIKPDNQAYVYQDFPLSMEIKSARDIKKWELIRKGDFTDINSISFQDAIANLNPEKGDQMLWLFRQNWNFGLYFDFSRQLDPKAILENLGHAFKTLLYFDLFQFFSNTTKYNDLIGGGWFPFIRLLNGQYENLIIYYEEDKKHFGHIKKIFESFNDKIITEMTERWWKNAIANSKKVIIKAGIDSYLSKTQSGYVNCIKNLISEIEGIIRIAYFKDTGRSEATVKDLKNYIVQSGHNQFMTLTNFGFTSNFMDYLSESIFKGFDLNTSNIPASRHSVSHGVADTEIYNQERALQLILTIDQIVFFLGDKNVA